MQQDANTEIQIYLTAVLRLTVKTFIQQFVNTEIQIYLITSLHFSSKYIYAAKCKYRNTNL